MTTTPNPNDAAPYVSGDPYADYRPATDPAFAKLTELTDLADRRLGGAVIAANDEFFAERENLLVPTAAVFDPDAFGHKGKVMDGWETRRRRGTAAATPHPTADDYDWAVIRLGVPGVIHGVLVDTAHFRGNYPQQVAVDGATSPDGPWQELVARTDARGHAANGFAVASEQRFTHLRLRQYPDGGVARLRVYGDPVPDPQWLELLGGFDLACVVNGGSVEAASDRFFSDPANLIRPDLSRKMDDGWETRRRRDDGHDWAIVTFAGEGEIRALELDTAYYKGNSAGWASVEAYADGEWREILPRTQLAPDAPHRFPLAAPARATRLRVNIYPDGSIARLRAHGTLTEDGWTALRKQYNA
ncbi:allantoicase [Streptomyces boninensis]|uniref:allantoicase n=1 Tax=Streptomyces boninensis TaxID=2039455 RepID=UPI003B21EC21